MQCSSADSASTARLAVGAPGSAEEGARPGDRRARATGVADPGQVPGGLPPVMRQPALENRHPVRFRGGAAVRAPVAPARRKRVRTRPRGSRGWPRPSVASATAAWQVSPRAAAGGDLRSRPRARGAWHEPLRSRRSCRHSARRERRRRRGRAHLRPGGEHASNEGIPHGCGFHGCTASSSVTREAEQVAAVMHHSWTPAPLTTEIAPCSAPRSRAVPARGCR